MVANPPPVTDMSDLGGALANRPEASFVVAAVDAVLDGDGYAARDRLVDGARATSWADVLHRLDVAGRALTADAGLTASDVPFSVAGVVAVSRRAGVEQPPVGVAAVLRAWSEGSRIPVGVDLRTQRVDPTADVERGWAASLVLAWLVERAGFPAQVVA